mgnify:CR=1 FL=1
MKFNVEEYRIVLSRILALIALVFLCDSRSYWETENKTLASLFILTGIILVAIASLGTMRCSVYIPGCKDEKPITNGPCSICRNPLYFFQHGGKDRSQLLHGNFFSDSLYSFFQFIIRLLSEVRKDISKTFLETLFKTTKKESPHFSHSFPLLKIRIIFLKLSRANPTIIFSSQNPNGQHRSGWSARNSNRSA